MHHTLKDAYEVTDDPRFLSTRGTQIWYYKRSEFRNFGMGSRGLDSPPSVDYLSLTHVFLGYVDETNPSNVFEMMQGEYWSPNGEARTMTAISDSGHTSMSVGDIMVLSGGKALMVDRTGFYNLAEAPVSPRMASMRTLTASDRSALIKLASGLHAGSSERRGIIARTILELKLKDGSIIPARTVVTVSFNDDKPGIANCTVWFQPGMVDLMYKTYKIKTITLFKYFGRPFTKVPGRAALERMISDGVAKTVTGKRTEPDGFGDDDSPSWLLVLGYI